MKKKYLVFGEHLHIQRFIVYCGHFENSLSISSCIQYTLCTGNNLADENSANFLEHFHSICLNQIFQIEYRAKKEALRLREMEQKELERKYGKKKAKEVAQQNFQVNIFV